MNTTFYVSSGSAGEGAAAMQQICELLQQEGWEQVALGQHQPGVCLVAVDTVDEAEQELDSLPPAWRAHVILVGMEGAGIRPQDHHPSPGTFPGLLERYGVAGHLSERFLDAERWPAGAIVAAKHLMTALGGTPFKHSQTERYAAWSGAQERDAKRFLVALVEAIAGGTDGEERA